MSLMLLGILNSQAAGGGGAAFDLLETTTLTTTASTVTFSGLSAYAADYKHLQLRMSMRDSLTAFASNNYDLRVNGDGGLNYAQHKLYANGSSVASQGNTSAQGIRSMELGTIPSASSVSGNFGATVADFLDFSSASKYKTMRVLGGHTVSGRQEISLQSGLWLNTAAITSLEIRANGQNFLAGCRLSLFGIKGA